MVFPQKLLVKAHFIVKMTSPAMVQPASSDFGKVPECGVKLMRKCTFVKVIITQLLLHRHFIGNCLSCLLKKLMSEIVFTTSQHKAVDRSQNLEIT